jgi:hypothetical protein
MGVQPVGSASLHEPLILGQYAEGYYTSARPSGTTASLRLCFSNLQSSASAFVVVVVVGDDAKTQLVQLPSIPVTTSQSS